MLAAAYRKGRTKKKMIDEIFAISSDVRYVAIYKDGNLESKSKDNTGEVDPIDWTA